MSVFLPVSPLWARILSYSAICQHHYTLMYMQADLAVQLCPSLWLHGVYSPPGFSVHGVFQARILEYFSSGSNLHLPHWQADSLPTSHVYNTCLLTECKKKFGRVRLYQVAGEMVVLNWERAEFWRLELMFPHVLISSSNGRSRWRSYEFLKIIYSKLEHLMAHYWVSEMMLRARKKSAKRVGWNTPRETLTSSWREVGAGRTSRDCHRWRGRWKKCGEDEGSEFYMGGYTEWGWFEMAFLGFAHLGRPAGHDVCSVTMCGPCQAWAALNSVQSLSRVWLFVTPGTVARQASLSITNSQSPPKPMSIESVMPSSHLILCHLLLLLPSLFPSIRVFSNESALHIRWPKYRSFSSGSAVEGS